MEIYERIRELRKKHLKMSMEAFGKRLGVSLDVISNIENNRLSRPEQKLSLYKLICSEFNISEDWLLNGNGDMRADKEAEYDALIDNVMSGENEFAKNIFKTFARFEEADWEALQHMIETYLSISEESNADADASIDTATAAEPVEQSADELEAAYKKSRLNSAQKTGLSASSTDGGTAPDAGTSKASSQ